MTNLVTIKNKVNKQLANKETMQSLIQTTFKGLTEQLVKRAIMEGMMRGFTFKDFLEKNIYAIPFNNKRNNELTYSLVTSVDYARKIGMRSGVVGKSAPTFVEDEKGNIISCTVTIKRKVNEYVGDYTATVFFKEYNTGYQQWATKPHTMIAKVAEMHALRMACPEEMSQMYVEEEMKPDDVVVVDVTEHEKKLRDSKNLEELRKNWLELPATARQKLEKVKDEVKLTLKSTEEQPVKKEETK